MTPVTSEEGMFARLSSRTRGGPVSGKPDGEPVVSEFQRPEREIPGDSPLKVDDSAGGLKELAGDECVSIGMGATSSCESCTAERGCCTRG